MRESITEFQGGTSWLSNTFPCIIDTSLLKNDIDDIVYLQGIFPSVEHAYKSCKFDDLAWKYYCLTQRKVSEIILRSFTNEKNIEISDRWNIPNRLRLMLALNRLKYNQEPFKRMLLNTTDRELIEGNTHGDIFWGIDKNTKVGENMLGKILMDIRTELQNNK